MKHGVIESGDDLGVREDERLRGRLEINTVIHICAPSVRPVFCFISSVVCWPPSSWAGEDFEEEDLQHSDQMGRLLFLYLLVYLLSGQFVCRMFFAQEESDHLHIFFGQDFFFLQGEQTNVARKQQRTAEGTVVGERIVPRVSCSHLFFFTAPLMTCCGDSGAVIN